MENGNRGTKMTREKRAAEMREEDKDEMLEQVVKNGLEQHMRVRKDMKENKERKRY